ncbi:MAG: hypothetical protein JXM79_20165 [Sedimentisphaerales bacterium]|nr:hypothetical protein [Sedimentisphaerales bacterium]
MQADKLDVNEIQKTISRLYQRINDRFPEAGLVEVCRRLHEVSLEADKTVRWIARPNYWLRAGVGGLITLVTGLLVASLLQLKLDIESITLYDFIQITEAAVSELVLIGAGIITLITYENRRKRHRVIEATNRLRSIAHVVDAHQLTKDPDRLSKIHTLTPHSPSEGLDAFGLGRYLDYCTEMLALISKLGFLFVQDFHDPVATAAVNDLENLTTGLSRKIWQKIIILRNRPIGVDG